MPTFGYAAERAKPCPLCGSNRIVIEESGIDMAYTLYIKCYDCGLTGYKNFFAETPVKTAEEMLLNYWNKRAEE